MQMSIDNLTRNAIRKRKDYFSEAFIPTLKTS
jgi:hypothetical protein